MAKSSGITSTYSLDDSGGTLRDISTAVLSFEISTPRGVFDITGLDKSAIERMLGLADCQLSLNAQFDPTATTGVHTVLRTMSSSSAARTATIVINSTPTATLSVEVVCSECTWSRSQDGNLLMAATLMLQNGAVPTWS